VRAGTPDRDADISAAINRQLRLQPRYAAFGYRRWRVVLQQREGLTVNHKRLRRVLRLQGLSQARIERTRNHTGSWVDWKPKAPNRVWQMDMTKVYIDGGGWLHHIAVIDLFDRALVGHHESLRARAEDWELAWDDALLNRFPHGPRGSGLVLQVDNGCQPTSRSFREHIAVSGARLAYIGIGQPEHNAFIERYFRSLKEEEVWPTVYETVEEAKQGILY
jgi:putative transposase